MKKQSTSKGFAVLGASSILCKVLALVYLPVQSAIMGDDGNGVIKYGYAVYTFVYSLANVGLPIAISKFVSECVAKGDYRGTRRILRCAFAVLVVLGLAAMIFMFAGAHWLAVTYSGDPRAEFMYKVFAPTFLFTAVNCALRGYFQGRQDMTPTAASQLIEQALNTAFTVLMIWSMFSYAKGHGLNAVSWGAAGSSFGTLIGAAGAMAFLICLFFHVYARQRHKEYKRQTYNGPSLSTGRIYREIFKYSVPAIISSIATSALDLIDAPTCKRMLLAAGFNPLQAGSLWGVYSTQYQRMFTLAIAFTTPLVTAMIPAISASLANRDIKQFRHKIGESYKLIFLVMFPSIAGLTFLAKPIITLIFIHRNAGADLVIAGTWTAVFMAVSYIQSGILIALGRPLISPVNTIVGMVPKLLCNFLLIRIHSVNIYGAIIGNALSWIVAIVLNQYFIDRTIDVNAHVTRRMLLPAVASAVMGVGCLLVYSAFNALFGLLHHAVAANDLAVIVSVFAGILIYFTMMLRIGGISREDLLQLPMGGKLCRMLARLPFLRGVLT